MSVHSAELFEDVKELPKNIRIALVVADFNDDITHTIAAKTKKRLEDEWFMNIDIFRVPGAFELPAMTELVTEKWVYNLSIVIWCVIRGETPHFDYICEATSNSLAELSTKCKTPITFWLLTCDTIQQAKERVNDNYAIYGLNYLVQRMSAENVVDARYQEIMESASEALKDMS